MQAHAAQIQIQQMLTTTPPAFSNSEAMQIAARHFGIGATAKPLVSERDQNFQLKTSNGRRFTLKIANHAEQLEVIDFQNRALMHIAERNASIPVPRVIPSLDQQLHCSVEKNGKTHIVRVLSWLDGMVLHESKADSDLVYRLGSLLAALGGALKDFDHPGSNPPLLWDMKRAAGLRDLLIHIDEPELRQLIARTLDQFESKAKPVLDTLRVQVIHNDMNRGNVLLDKANPDKISGIIDFGDMVKSPLIIDLAVAASYQLHEGGDPLAGVLPLIAGYHRVTPLHEAELRILTDLIRTRLITSLLISSCRVKLFPANTEYLMTSHDSARRFLIHLDELDNNDAYDRIRTYLLADQESCTP
jgi:Ser/Thr protein kinase RdoA (MazF antagonist)